MLSVVVSLLYSVLILAISGEYDVDLIIPFIASIGATTLVIYLGIYVLKAIAICIMAKKRKIKWWWVGMLPYANYALIGKLAGPIRIFHFDIKNIGIITAITAFVLDLSNVFGSLIPCIQIYMMLLNGDVMGVESILGIASGIFYDFIEIFVYVADIAFVISYFSLVYAIFGKYAPQKRLLYSVLSLIQPLFSIFLFVVRNNKAYQNIDDYYREKMANRFGQTYNPYQNPYQTKENPFDDYSNNNNNNNSNNNENPFDEF